MLLNTLTCLHNPAILSNPDNFRAGQFPAVIQMHIGLFVTIR